MSVYSLFLSDESKDLLADCARQIMRKKRIIVSLAPLTPTEQQFLRIASLVDQASAKARAQGLHPDEPLDGDDYKAETEELIDLSRAFSHSAAFTTLVEQATAQTLDRIAHDKQLRGRLREWEDLPKQLKRQSLQVISNLFFKSADDHVDIELNKPTVRLYSKARNTFKSEKTSLILGHYTSMGIGSGHIININTHSDTNFHNVSQAAYTNLHEAVHGLEETLGWMTPNFSTLTQSFGHDAELWRAQKSLHATIPSRIYPAYRIQYHEDLAHSLEKPVTQGMRAIL